MKIGEYEQMMAYLTRPGFNGGSGKKPTTVEELKKSGQIVTGDKYKPSNPKLIKAIRDFELRNPRKNKSEGGPLVPEPKPLTEEIFKENADRFIKGALGGFPKDEMITKLQEQLDKVQESGTFSKEQAINFINERTKQLREFIKQNPGETLPGLETREEFKYGTVPGEGNSKISYDPETDTYRKRVQETVDGKKTNKYIYSEPGQSLEDFKKIKPVRSTGAIDATVKSRQFIDDWTKNWFDNNLKNYGVRDFDVMINDLSKDWSEILESGDVPKGATQFKLATPELGLPNVTSGRDAKGKKGAIEPFSYNNVKFYANLDSSKEQIDKTLAQYKKIFYKNQIETDTNLRTELDRFFNFMARDKKGFYRTPEGKTISQFMDGISDDAKYLLNDEASGLKRSSKKEVFNAFEDLASNYNKYTQNKARLKAVQSVTEAKIKAGPKTSGQTDKLIKQIKDQNKLVAKMSPEELAKNKNFIQSLRLVINPQTGEVNFSGYTENDPKVKTKGVKSDLELAEHAIERAKDPAKKGGLFGYDHISKRSFGKMNTQFPNNIQSANYITNVQLENARRFLSVPENRNTPAAQNLDKVLEDLNLTIRGKKEYGGTYGNKINIEVPANTGRSNLIDSQLFKNVDKFASQRGFIDPRLLGADKLAKAAKLYGPAAGRIAQMGLKTGLGAFPVEGLFMGDMQQRGLSPKEMALDIGTVGIGTIFKDIKEKADYVKSKGFGDELQSAFRKQTVAQQARPTLGGVEGMFKEPTLTDDEQRALKMYNLDAQNIIDMRRQYQSGEYEEMDKAFGYEDPIMRGGAMDGGIMRLGFKDGTEVPVVTMDDKIDELISFYQDYLKKGGKMNFMTFAKKYIPENFATGGRAGFADGPSDPSKRKFIKIMGGLASIPIVGKFFKPAAKITEAAAPVIQKTFEGAPAHFINLYKKIKNLGDDVTEKSATKEREIVTEYEDYRLTEDVATGETTIQRLKTDSDFSYYDENLAEETYMNYRPGKGQSDEVTGPVADEYIEDTSYIRTSGPSKGDIYDTVDGVPDDVIEEGTKFEDNFMDFEPKKKNDK